MPPFLRLRAATLPGRHRGGKKKKQLDLKAEFEWVGNERAFMKPESFAAFWFFRTQLRFSGLLPRTPLYLKHVERGRFLLLNSWRERSSCMRNLMRPFLKKIPRRCEGNLFKGIKKKVFYFSYTTKISFLLRIFKLRHVAECSSKKFLLLVLPRKW